MRCAQLLLTMPGNTYSSTFILVHMTLRSSSPASQRCPFHTIWCNSAHYRLTTSFCGLVQTAKPSKWQPRVWNCKAIMQRSATESPAHALNALPSIGRDTSTFTTLQPGITPDGSVAGVAVDQSSFQLDGGDNTNDMDGTMGIYRPSYAGAPPGGVASQSNGVAAAASGVMPTPVDSVEELKVNVAGMAADFNSSAGAQVQIVTKRGTDQWHGTAYCALMIHETKDGCCLSAASQSVPR